MVFCFKIEALFDLNCCGELQNWAGNGWPLDMNVYILDSVCAIRFSEAKPVA